MGPPHREVELPWSLTECVPRGDQAPLADEGNRPASWAAIPTHAVHTPFDNGSTLGQCGVDEGPGNASKGNLCATVPARVLLACAFPRVQIDEAARSWTLRERPQTVRRVARSLLANANDESEGDLGLLDLNRRQQARPALLHGERDTSRGAKNDYSKLKVPLSHGLTHGHD